MESSPIRVVAVDVQFLRRGAGRWFAVALDDAAPRAERLDGGHALFEDRRDQRLHDESRADQPEARVAAMGFGE